MNTRWIGLWVVVGAVLLAFGGCSRDSGHPTKGELAAAVNAKLAENGAWLAVRNLPGDQQGFPRTVSTAEGLFNSGLVERLNSIHERCSALVKAGLLTAKNVEQYGRTAVTYDLTELGKKYASGLGSGRFRFGKVRVQEVGEFTIPAPTGAGLASSVDCVIETTIEPWAQAPAIRAAFGEVAEAMRAALSKQTFEVIQTSNGWKVRE